MWLFVFFDLPVKTKQGKRFASNFRKELLRDGYIMVQYSVYARPCGEHLEKHRRRLEWNIPPQGSVRVLAITDRQYKNMEEIVNPTEFEELKEHQSCEQLLLF